MKKGSQVTKTRGNLKARETARSKPSTSEPVAGAADEIDTWLPIVNELIPGAPPVGAYAMGMATVAGVMAGRPPDRVLLELVLEARTIKEADKMICGWLAVKHARA
jgi:hypothetical protein